MLRIGRCFCIAFKPIHKPKPTCFELFGQMIENHRITATEAANLLRTAQETTLKWNTEYCGPSAENLKFAIAVYRLLTQNSNFPESKPASIYLARIYIEHIHNGLDLALQIMVSASLSAIPSTSHHFEVSLTIAEIHFKSNKIKLATRAIETAISECSTLESAVISTPHNQTPQMEMTNQYCHERQLSSLELHAWSKKLREFKLALLAHSLAYADALKLASTWINDSQQTQPDMQFISDLHFYKISFATNTGLESSVTQVFESAREWFNTLSIPKDKESRQALARFLVLQNQMYARKGDLERSLESLNRLHVMLDSELEWDFEILQVVYICSGISYKLSDNEKARLFLEEGLRLANLEWKQMNTRTCNDKASVDKIRLICKVVSRFF